MHALQLTWKMEGCTPGVDDSADNPLARAVDRLFRDGKPFKRLNKCFYCGPDSVFRWLGVFVHSAGDRVLFFPGFSDPQSHVLAYDERALRWNQAFQIDHLSLESDGKTWHLTAPKSASHLGRLNAVQLPSGGTHWFSMSVATPENLRIVRNETLVMAPSPPQDSERRIEEFRKVREGAVFQIVGLNTEHPVTGEPTFLHFSVLVGSPGFPASEDLLLALPYGSPFLPESPVEWSGTAPIRMHRVLVSESVELLVTASALPGRLQTPLLFSGQAPGGK